MMVSEVSSQQPESLIRISCYITGPGHTADQSEAGTVWHWPMGGGGEIWVRALAWSPGPVVTLGHIITRTGSQVLGSSLGPAANERPGCGSRDPGRPIGGRYCDRVPGPAHPGCVGLSQSELGPVATHRPHWDLQRGDYELTRACDILSCFLSLYSGVIVFSSEQPMSGECGERAQPRDWAVSCSHVGDGKQQRVYSEEIFWWAAEILGDTAETRRWVESVVMSVRPATLGTDDLIPAQYHLLDLSQMIQNSSCDDWLESTPNTPWWLMILVLNSFPPNMYFTMMSACDCLSGFAVSCKWVIKIGIMANNETGFCNIYDGVLLSFQGDKN